MDKLEATFYTVNIILAVTTILVICYRGSSNGMVFRICGIFVLVSINKGIYHYAHNNGILSTLSIHENVHSRVLSRQKVDLCCLLSITHLF